MTVANREVVLTVSHIRSEGLHVTVDHVVAGKCIDNFHLLHQSWYQEMIHYWPRKLRARNVLSRELRARFADKAYAAIHNMTIPYLHCNSGMRCYFVMFLLV